MALQVWLPLDGDLRNQGLLDSQITNNGAAIDNNGKIGKCYSFNSNNKLIFNLSSNITSAIGSLACWVYFNALPGNSSFFNLIQIGTQGGYANCRLGLYMEYTNKINISINGSTTNQNIYTHSLSTNTWYHLCATFDGTIVKLYIDGIEVLSKEAIIGSYNTAVSNMFVGGTNSYYLNGKLNDIRYYDHALSAKEVKELSKGLILHYRLSKPMPNILKNTGINTAYSTSDYNNGTWGGTSGGNGTFSIVEDLTVPVGRYSWNILNNTSGNRDYDQGKIPFKVNQVYTASWWAKGNGKILFRIWDSTNGVARITDQTNNLTSEWTFYSKTFTATQIMQDNLCRYKVGVTGSANIYICGMKLEEGEVATIWIPNESDTLYSALGYDSDIELDCAPAGNQNDGTIVGTITAAADSPRYESSYHFASGVNYINFSNFPKDALQNSYTFSWWEKGLKSGNMPWGFQNGNRLNVYHTSPICWNTGNGTSNPFQIDANTNLSSTTLCDNNWHHVAVTGNGSITNIYIDGEYKAKAKTYQGITGTNLFLSGWDTGSGYKINDGYLSDFRVYCTALSAEDIKELYNTAAQIDKDGNVYAYEFEENNNQNITKTGIMSGGLLEDTNVAKINKNDISLTTGGNNITIQAPIEGNGFYEY